jgi:protein farnesyltransferase/geranylgeranyltransferase type-1 subunit alpha
LHSSRQYRYETVVEIQWPLDTEIALMDELADKYLKTYQVWHHRRLILTLSKKAREELAFVANILQKDEKNYHTWAHRQWVLAFYNDDALWAGELDFVDTMINKDVRNNSVWHHRFFVVFQSGVRDGEEDRERVVRRELMYVLCRRAHQPKHLVNVLVSSQLHKAEYLARAEQRVGVELPSRRA